MKTALAFAATLSLVLAGCGPKTSSDDHANMNHGQMGTANEHSGMAGMDMAPDHDRTPTMRVALEPAGPFTSGRSQQVALTLTDLATGKPMGPADVALAHTKRLHLLIIDGSLTDYQHIHPLPDAKQSGVWRFAFAPRFARPYKVWADVTRPNGKQEYVAVELAAGRQPAPAPTATTALTAEADGLAFRLSFPKPLKVGEAIEGAITITDRATGKPFAGLQPIMGAFGHIVAFAGDWDSIEHVHPMGTEPTTDSARSGPTIRFHLQPEKAGVLKLFAQIEANGRETIVPFTTAVQP